MKAPRWCRLPATGRACWPPDHNGFVFGSLGIVLDDAGRLRHLVVMMKRTAVFA